VQILSFSHYNLRAPRELLDELRLFYTEVVGLEQGLRPPFPRFGYWLYAGAQDFKPTQALITPHLIAQADRRLSAS
jgi:catechol 2,3-dioxygenase-like lactoylglutathione lyase family enzyme